MSALQRSALSARIAKLPQLPSGVAPAIAAADVEDEDEEEEEETDDLGALPSTLGRPNLINNAEYAPISAASYFAQAVEVDVTASRLSSRVYYTPSRITGPKGTVMICHHGAGFSALSFACLAQEVDRLSHGECGVLALDARAHGKTSSHVPDEESDLSIERLCSDLVELIQTIFPTPLESPSLLVRSFHLIGPVRASESRALMKLVGHSMGGAVIVRASSPLLAAKYRVVGVAVLDVVEGFTLEALPHMHTLLDSRPDGFDSQEEAIKWHVSTNTIRNTLSARISVPPIIVPSDKTWKWRTPLRSTAPYWSNWFTGLSSTFLAARTARLLVLAGTERLDKELMIGQMQGKFQMVVVPNVGHMVHEDDPTRLAEILVEFWKRNDRVLLGIKKVGES